MAVLTNTMLQGSSAVEEDTGYKIEKSLRFNDDDANKMSRIFGAGNQRRYTWAGWIKRGEAGSGGCFFSSCLPGGDTDDPRTDWQFISDQLLISFNPTGSSWIEIKPSHMFRDHSAWFHLCVIVDSNNVVSADRVKIYINGDREYSFTTNNSISAGTELHINSANEHQIGAYTAGTNYFDGQLADVFFLDGVLVHPSAFGEKDSTGAWNPKNPYNDAGDFKLRTPNNGTTWSTYLTGVRGGSAETVTTPAGTFNHNLGIYGRILHSSGDQSTLNFNPPGDGITGQKIRLYCYQPQGTSGSRNRLSLNGGEFREDVLWAGVGANADGWTKEIEIPGGVLTSLSLKLTYAGNSSQTIWAIEIDGVILVDGWTDHPTRKTNLYGTTWSAGTTAGGPYENNATKWGWPTAFNGYMVLDSNLEVEANSNDPAYKLTLTNQPAWETSIALWIRADSDNPNSTFKVNGVDQTGNIPDGTSNSTGVMKVRCTGISSPLTSIEVGLTSGSTFVAVTAVEIDGHILIDNDVDNSFHFKFDDVTANRNLGYSQVMNTPTGAQPMYGTGASDSAKASLVWALPGYDTADHSHTIKGSGSAVSHTVNGSVVSTTQSQFYGSSLYFDGSNDDIQSPVSTDFQLGTSDFTIEGWFYMPSSGFTAPDGWVQCSAGNDDWSMLPFYRSSDGNLYFYGTATSGDWDWSAKNYGAIATNKWTHYAVVRNGSTFKGYTNGKEAWTFTSSDSVYQAENQMNIGSCMNGGNAFAIGYLNDFRYYKGAAKYTANFIPPARNDFTVSNFSAIGDPRSIADSTKALPIYNTTGTHGGTKGSGYRADPLKANLVLAIPGDVLTDVSNHADLRNSGSAKATDANGNCAVSTAKSRFYGSSIAFDGVDDYLEVGNSADYNMDGDFCAEAWIYINAYTNDLATIFGFRLDSESAGWNLLMRSDGAMHMNVQGNSTDVANATVPLGKWTHVALVRNGTSNANCRVYVNGVSGTTTLSENDTTGTPSGSECMIGSYIGYETTREFNGYIQDVRIYKGVAKYTANFDSELPLLGTPENIDSLVDSPTSYGSDAGKGGEMRSNYATLNPLELTYGAMTFAQGNLKATANANWCASVASIHPKSGKFYWEVIPSTANSYIGVQAEGSSNSAQNPQNNAGNLIYYGGDGKRKTATTYTAYGDAYGLGDVIGVALDLDSSPQTVTYYKNNTSQGTLNLSLATGIENSYVRPAFYVYNAAIEVNFGQRAFKYTAPAGFKCLCTKNLDDVFSGDELNNPSKYFDILTYSGLGAAQTITGLNFQPELIWIKNYSGGSTSHSVYDTANGQGSNGYYRIEPDTADPVADESNVTAITSDGFTVTSAGGYTNQLGGKHAAFCWDAGTAAATASTDGSITPSAQWKNATAGFSISKYDGTGSNATVGHGLGAKPEFVLVKCLDTADQDWNVYHTSLATGDFLKLNLNNAVTDYPVFNDSHPTNTTVPLGDHGIINGSGHDYIMYCWTPIAGYSHFGTYEGNGSTTGPFVYTGFSPHWILFKNIDSGEHWRLQENTIDAINPVSSAFYPNLQNQQETTSAFDLDFLSNGFKVRNTDSTTNTSGHTYVYACFARNPFKTARAR